MFFRSKNKDAQKANTPAAIELSAVQPVTKAPDARPAASPVSALVKEGTEQSPLPSAQPPTAAIGTDPDRKRRIALARKKSAAFGQVVAVMARSEQHRNLPLGEVRWLVAPPVRCGQFMLAGKRLQKNGMVVPTAALMWARVSDEIDKKLAASTTPMRLAPKAWTSGDNLWLIEAVGDATLVPKMIEQLGSREWKGKTVKVRARQPDGSLGVQAIGPL